MICYKFLTRDQFRALAAAEGVLTDDSEQFVSSHTYAIDEIGIIENSAGWHVNTMHLSPDAWAPYLIAVNNPVRIFLGDPAIAAAIP